MLIAVNSPFMAAFHEQDWQLGLAELADMLSEESPSRRDERSQLLPLDRLVAKANEHFVEGRDVKLRRRWNLDPDGSPVSGVVHQQAAVGPFGPRARVPVFARQIVVCRDGPALAIRDFQIGVSHGRSTG